MLLEITIKNFAIIEEISLNFENGMTVLTGETGAGKSIIIDAMNLMLGARASSEVVRHSASKAEIQGFFSIEQTSIEIFFFNFSLLNFLAFSSVLACLCCGCGSWCRRGVNIVFRTVRTGFSAGYDGAPTRILRG